MAEGAASWHGFVAAKRVEGDTESADMEVVTNNDNLAANAKLGCSDAVNAEFRFVTKRAVPICTYTVQYKSGISIEHDICGASICTSLVIGLDDGE